MSNLNSRNLEGTPSWMRFAPYAALGLLIFSFNSGSELNYFLRGYLVIIQAQAGIVCCILRCLSFAKTQINE